MSASRATRSATPVHNHVIAGHARSVTWLRHEQRRSIRVGREVAHPDASAEAPTASARASRASMARDALERVGRGDLARDHERPVARLQAKQLAHGAHADIAARGEQPRARLRAWRMRSPRPPGPTTSRGRRRGPSCSARSRRARRPAPRRSARGRHRVGSARAPDARTPRRPPRASARPHTTSGRTARYRPRRR